VPDFQSKQSLALILNESTNDHVSTFFRMNSARSGSSEFKIFVNMDDSSKLKNKIPLKYNDDGVSKGKLSEGTFSLQTSADHIHVKSEHWCRVGRMFSKLEIHIVSSTYIIIDSGNTS
jgi:hypothetical protein